MAYYPENNHVVETLPNARGQWVCHEGISEISKFNDYIVIHIIFARRLPYIPNLPILNNKYETNNPSTKGWEKCYGGSISRRRETSVKDVTQQR